MSDSPVTVQSLLADVADVGRDARRGGYSRFAYGSAELELREWFTGQAVRRSMDVETDRNGAIWAWRPGTGGSLDDAVVTGSHLDSVPGGGAFDGPLGIASAFVALDAMDARSDAGGSRPLAIVAFPEEEGGRFGLPCLGSRLMTGAIAPDRALRLTDDDGVTYAEALRRNGLDPHRIGRDDTALARMHSFVELHVEQGHELAERGRPVGIGSSILSHGRWRLTVTGHGGHAGARPMADRHDAMVTAAAIVVDVRNTLRKLAGARGSIGRIQTFPGSADVIAARVDLWLDLRHPDDAVARTLVQVVRDRAELIASAEGCVIDVVEETYHPAVSFDAGLVERVSSVLPEAPVLPTGAGHDAGVLSVAVPTTMLFTRNPSGISHSPDEYVEDADGEAGAAALADVLHALRHEIH